MRLSHPLVAAAALALLVAPACTPARAEAPWGAPDEGYAAEEPYEPEDAPDPDGYRENLAPYGEWQDVPDYGVVWRPTYMAGWQPYVDGYWAWTSYGWTWVSYEPWAWTLHYGRWAVVPAYGWVWVPGTVWGPAWVDWYWGAGYVGWAPLSPFGSVTVINNFVFVNERDFCSHDVRRHFVHHRHLSHGVRRDWNDRGHRRAPGRDRIERVSRDTVTRFDDRPRNTLAPRRDRDRRTGQPELTRARRDREVRDGTRRARPERPDTVSRSNWGDRSRTDPRLRERQSRFDDDDLEPARRQPPAGWTGSSHGQPRPERGAPRVRGPRFDRDVSGQVQVRPHAWSAEGGRHSEAPRGRENPSSMSETGPGRAGGGQREGGGAGRARGGGVGMGMGMGMGMGGASPGAR